MALSKKAVSKVGKAKRNASAKKVSGKGVRPARKEEEISSKWVKYDKELPRLLPRHVVDVEVVRHREREKRCAARALFSPLSEEELNKQMSILLS